MNTPLHILSLGAGVQSSTLALMAAEGAISPMPSCAIFADTMAEPSSVYRWLDWLEPKLPFPVHRVSKGNLQEALLTVRVSRNGKNYTGSNVPAFLKIKGAISEGIQQRHCTKDFKINVLLSKVRELIGRDLLKECKTANAMHYSAWAAHNKEKAAATRQKRRCESVFPTRAFNAMQASAAATQWIGISRDELYRVKPSRLPYIAHRWPLIDLNMTRAACLDWMKARGYPTPPRSACVFCPYHGDEEWLRLKQTEPEEFERAAQFERSYQFSVSKVQRMQAVPYLHRSLVPLREIDFVKLTSAAATKAAQQPDLFSNECEGICGV